MVAVPLIVVAALTSPLAGMPADSGPSRFWLGLVAGDTTLTPIALYEGGGWFNPWPPRDYDDRESARALDRLPLRWWGGIRPSLTWHLWRRRGGQLPLRIQGMVLPRECSAPWALQTNYRLRSDDARYEDSTYVRDVGIASDTELGVQPFVRVQDAEVNTFLAAAFDRLAQREVIRVKRQMATLSPASAEVLGRTLTPVRTGRSVPSLRYKVWTHIEPFRGARIHFSRTERRYLHDGIWGSTTTIVRMQAWVIRGEDDRLRLVAAQVDLVNLDPDHKALEPLALFRAGAEFYAVGVWQWSDGRDAHVLRVRASGVTLLASKVLSGC